MQTNFAKQFGGITSKVSIASSFNRFDASISKVVHDHKYDSTMSSLPYFAIASFSLNPTVPYSNGVNAYYYRDRSNNKATMFVILIIGLTAGPAVSL